MRKEDEKFDMMIKSILDEGQEEVPARIWDTINTRLDTAEAPTLSDRKKPIAIWLRNAGIGLAAAAAVTLSVLFSGIRQETPEYPDNTIAVVETDIVNQDSKSDGSDILLADAGATKKSKIDNIPTSAAEDVETSCIQQTQDFSHDTDAESTVVVDSEKNYTSNKPKSRTEANATPTETKEWADPFAEFEENAASSPKRKIKTSFTLSGNAISNSNAERSKDLAFMAPGVPTENKVTESSDSRYSIPLSFGIGARLTFTKHWSMSIGINYSFLSRRFDGNFYEVKDDGSYTNTHFSDIRNTQNYIGIPVNVYYSIIRGDFVDFYAYAGGSAEYCLTNKYIMHGTSGNITHNGNAGSFLFSANAGIGVEFILAKRVGLYIDPSVRYYFRNSNSPKSIRTDQPLMLGFEAGLRIRL